MMTSSKTTITMGRTKGSKDAKPRTRSKKANWQKKEDNESKAAKLARDSGAKVGGGAFC